jgi:hypothetical protein
MQHQQVWMRQITGKGMCSMVEHKGKLQGKGWVAFHHLKCQLPPHFLDRACSATHLQWGGLMLEEMRSQRNTPAMGWIDVGGDEVH